MSKIQRDGKNIMENIKRISSKNKEKNKKQVKKYQQENKDKIKKQRQKHYQKNKNRLCQISKKYQQENKDKIKKQVKKYRLKNKDKYSGYDIKYYQKNKDKVSKRHRKYYQKNKDNLRVRSRNYQLKHKNMIKKKMEEYYKKNPEKRLKIEMKRLKKLGFSLKLDPFPYLYAINSWSKTIRKLADELCQVCNSQAEISHHIFYKAKYPKLSLNLNNGIALCKNCHNEVHGWNLKRI